ALFLYKLLTPESQLAMPTSEEPVAFENTNPVVIDPSATLAARRRPVPEAQVEPPQVTPEDAWLPAPVQEVEEAVPPVEAAGAVEEAAALEANPILHQSADPAPD